MGVMGFLAGPLEGLADRWDSCRSVDEAQAVLVELEGSGFDPFVELRRADRSVADLYRRLLSA